MSLSKSATIAAWIGSLAALAGVFIAYRASGHSQAAGQTFSVVINQAERVQGVEAEGHRKTASLDFTVKNCDIGSKQVSCSLMVASPQYDRRFFVGYGTSLIDGDGDNFPLVTIVQLSLERDQPLPFKLSFNVNKNVVAPITIKMLGAIDNQTLDKGFQIK